MNGFESITKPLMWFMALLLAVVVAGCGGGSGSTSVPPSPVSTKAITAYSLAGVPGTIDETAKTIAVKVPYGTNVTLIAAAFKTTGASVTVSTVVQTSGTTKNDFTSPVVYTVTDADGTTATYTVTVTVALNFAKAITAYSLDGVAVTVNETTKTIAVPMPNGKNVTAMVATFTTTGTSVKIGNVTQTSPAAAHDFTNPVVYTVTAADGTTVNYTVTVNVANSSAKAITAYSLAGVAGTINETTPKTITVSVPSGTSLTALVATFATTGTSVMVGVAPQASGTTANDFTNPVDYTVTAADTTTATYTVTVTVANPGPAGASPNLGTASTYGIFASNAAVTLAVNSMVIGDVGLNLADACNNCVVSPGTPVTINGVIHNGDAAAILAQTDFKAAYDDAALRSTNACAVTGDLSAAQAACSFVTPSTPGPVYGPGLYRTATDITLSGTMMLDAGGNPDAVFIFQTDTAITTGSSSVVLLANGAQAKNVWWMAGSAATLGVSSHFKGTVIANGAAVWVLGGTASDPTLVEGRLFSHAAAATVDAYATVTVPQ